MARKKKIVITGKITASEAGEYMAKYAKSEAELKRINAEIEVKCHEIREKHRTKIEQLTTEQDLAFEHLQHFANTNPELFEKKKSTSFAHGIIGFRTATPKLALIKGFTWASVLTLVKDKLPTFVRTKEEVDKESLLAQRNDEGMADYLKKCGMEVAQDETFYVEPLEQPAVANA